MTRGSREIAASSEVSLPLRERPSNLYSPEGPSRRSSEIQEHRAGHLPDSLPRKRVVAHWCVRIVTRCALATFFPAPPPLTSDYLKRSNA